MTYGVAVPRFKPRPSLDVLREPLIPIEPPRGSTRPVKPTVFPQKKQPQQQPQLETEAEPEDGTADDPNITTDRHVLGTPILNPSVVHVPSTPTQASPLPLSQPQSPSYYQDPNPSNNSRPSSRRTSLLQVPSPSSPTPTATGARLGRGASRKEKKRRDLTPLRNATNTYEQLNAEEESYDDYQTDTELLNEDSDAYFERERSPSEFFETAVSYPVLLPPSHSHASTSSNQGDKAKNGNKKKSRLHLSLGRLGRHQELNETIRVRDELDYRVANPTFTRENLIQRNYDAFFESGEPVYSLEKRTLDTPDCQLEQPYRTQYQNTAMSSPSSYYSGGHRHSQDFFQHGLTGPAPSSPRPKTVSYMPMNAGLRSGSPAANAMLLPSSRAQSVELDSRRSTSSRRGVGEAMMGGGVTPKGDRCPSFNRFGLSRVPRTGGSACVEEWLRVEKV